MKNLKLPTATALAMVATASPVHSEEIVRLAGVSDEPTLLVRHEPGPGPSVLYVHGSTFPSALSISYKIRGYSWMDDLHSRGFDVWAFDIAGYGGSDRPSAMQSKLPAADLPGRAHEVAGEIRRVVLHLLANSGRKQVSIVAHSWGTIPAGIFAAQSQDLVEKLVLFGPLAERRGERESIPESGAYAVTADDQRAGFASGLPEGQGPLFAPELFDKWVEQYLATDPHSADRSPPSVLVPSGWLADFVEAWSGEFPYDPSTIRAPTLIVRGEWDDVTNDADVAWLRQALSGVPDGPRDIKLARGGHRMLLEENRQQLFDAVAAFLLESTQVDQRSNSASRAD